MSLVEVGAWDVQGFPPTAQPAPRQGYYPIAGKPVPSSHEQPHQAEGTSELNARKEGAHGWEKPEPQYSKPGGTHLCRA